MAPWLTTDDNPYPVVVNGRIVWIVDFTTLTPIRTHNAARSRAR